MQKKTSHYGEVFLNMIFESYFAIFTALVSLITVTFT